MQLRVVGAGPAYTNRAGATGAAYLVREGDHALLLDLGQGSFPALIGAIEPSHLDGVMISHLHPDHFIDLVPLRHYLHYQLQPARRIAVHAPRGLDERLDALHADPRFTAAAFELQPLEPGTRRIGPFTVEARRVAHTEDSYAFRVSLEEGPGLVYTGDCGRAEDVRPLVREGDVLLAEVSFGPGPVPPGVLHLDSPAVGDLAARTSPGLLLLTHLQMGYDREATLRAARERFSGPIDLVDPGFETTIGA